MLRLVAPLIPTTATLVTMAEWLVVSTFDDQRSLALIQEVHITGAGVTGDTGAYSDVIKGRWVVFPGALFTGTNNLFAFLDLGVDIKAASQAGGNSVTLYLEVTQPTVPDGFGGTRKAIVDVTWGTMNCGPSNVYPQLEHFQLGMASPL